MTLVNYCVHACQKDSTDLQSEAVNAPFENLVQRLRIDW